MAIYDNLGEQNKKSSNFATLWTNTNVSNNFSAQTITLSESMLNFDLIIIEYKVSVSIDAYASEVISPGKNAYLNMSGVTNFGRRILNYESETTIVVDSCTWNDSTNNSYLLPHKVYGIKF